MLNQSGNFLLKLLFIVLFSESFVLFPCAFVYSSDFNAVLLEAAENGNVDEVRDLLAAGANVNTINEYSVTPLMLAARGGVREVEILIDAGARLDEKDNNGSTALFHAAAWGNAAAVNLLLEAEADVNARNRYGEQNRLRRCWDLLRPDQAGRW